MIQHTWPAQAEACSDRPACSLVYILVYQADFPLGFPPSTLCHLPPSHRNLLRQEYELLFDSFKYIILSNTMPSPFQFCLEMVITEPTWPPPYLGFLVLSLPPECRDCRRLPPHLTSVRFQGWDPGFPAF